MRENNCYACGRPFNPEGRRDKGYTFYIVLDGRERRVHKACKRRHEKAQADFAS